MRVRGVLVGGVLAVGFALVTGSCSSVQQSLECPGEDCPESLQTVAEKSAQVPEVTGVDRAWRFFNIDKGDSGGVDVHASVVTRSDARAVADAISAIYQGSKIEHVDNVSVVVVPDPERAEQHDTESILGGKAGAVAEVPCAVDECAEEVAGFEDAFAAAPLAEGATLESVAWVGDDNPRTVIEVTAPDEPMDAAAFKDFESRLLDVTQDAGLPDIGDVRTLIHYQRRVEFSFQFDTTNGATG